MNPKPIDVNSDPVLRRKVRALYHRAFPAEERLPWWLLRLNSMRRDIDLTAWMDGDRFCGFTSSATVEGLHFLLFFAVAEDCRSQGRGSAILQAIQTRHPAVVLNIELLDPAAPNYPDRLRRFAFYRRNGFHDAHYHVWEVGGKFRVLSTDPVLDVPRYKEVFRKLTLGLWDVKLLKAED